MFKKECWFCPFFVESSDEERAYLELADHVKAEGHEHPAQRIQRTDPQHTAKIIPLHTRRHAH